MATTYGMGQYRMQSSNFNYIELVKENISPQTIEVKANTYTYKDIYFSLKDNDESFNYGETYYLELILPRHIQYTSDIDVKICGELNGTVDIENQFQNIRQITVPSSLANTNFYKDVILYSLTETDPSKIGIITTNSGYINSNYVYYNNNEYFPPENNKYSDESLNYYQVSRIPESWKLQEIDENTITYKMIFSPKFDGNGYPYLYLEIDRNNDWNTNIQYVDNNKTYRGLLIDINKAKLNVYKVKNLLGSTESGYIPHSSLNHIGVWGHPEMYLAINGEQIQIGKNGFYELDDFNITNLGVVVNPQDPNSDRFSIDYEFII